MLKAKQKKCSRCGETTVIWKSEGREKYCKQCWSCHKTSGVRQTSAKTSKTTLSPRSPKQRRIEAAYAVLRKNYLETHPMCEAHLAGCATHATDIHHKAGRGTLTLDSTTFLAVCRSCHMWIETHPKESKDLGFSTNRLNTNNNED